MPDEKLAALALQQMRLNSAPQLLYFLNRLRTEFDRPRLPQRSFMPELVRSSNGKAF